MVDNLLLETGDDLLLETGDLLLLEFQQPDATAFQSNAFQGNAFQIGAPAQAAPAEVTYFAGQTDYLRRRVYPAATLANGFFWGNTTPTITVEKFLQPLAEPVRRRGFPVYEQQSIAWTQPENVTAGRWYGSIGEPVRTRPGLPVYDQLHAVWTPIRVAEGWNYPTSQPTLAKRKVQPDGTTWSYYVESGEIITVDKWYVEWSTPQRQKIGLAAYNQQATFYIGADPFPETVSVDRWLQPLSEPIRRKGLGPAWQQAVLFVHNLEFAGWLQPIPEPVRAKPRSQPEGTIWSYYVESGEIITPDKWYVELSTPRRSRPGLGVWEQQATFYIGAAPFGENVLVSSWAQATSQPTRRKDQSSMWQMYSGQTMFTPTPPAPGGGKTQIVFI